MSEARIIINPHYTPGSSTHADFEPVQIGSGYDFRYVFKPLITRSYTPPGKWTPPWAQQAAVEQANEAAKGGEP